MNAVPADGPFVWIALLVVSASVLGVVTALPSAPPPDAVRVATAVDEVAATDHAASAIVPLEATKIRVETTEIGLRDAGGTAHASFNFGPVTPAPRDSALSEVAAGATPARAFDSPLAFAAALERARSGDHDWEPAGEELRIRRVQYGEVEGVLVTQ
ncbi:DUF7283 family protein [Halanaeroarchaeum sulfurireducens]|uniref:Uncharacterized protein n=1 Tax=Halanaeroarchaeum sulfurireducens TaxID=1604004 RepID=A0A0N9MH48_9EURY|nr:hypothetical protein [Halanaeroarchaeum sulfurireducens]ALG81493.1 hypothetical protein HLASA_0592 [Halanaeroarchaeum sulfurireducens]